MVLIHMVPKEMTMHIKATGSKATMAPTSIAHRVTDQSALTKPAHETLWVQFMQVLCTPIAFTLYKWIKVMV